MQVCRPQVVQKSVCWSVTFWQIQTVQLFEQFLTFTKNIRITKIFTFKTNDTGSNSAVLRANSSVIFENIG